MQEIKAEKLLIKTEKLLKRFIKILWQNKLKLFLAFLGVVAITGGVILATGGSFTINKSPKLSLTDGLVGMWSFDGDDIAGTTAYDRSGQGNDGTLTNGPTKTMGKIGQALEFDDNNYVDFGGADLIHESDNWTITVWGKPSVGGSTDGFVGVGGTTGETWTLEMNNDYMRVVVGGGEAQANYTDPSLNEWHHYIFLRNGDDFEAYIDGVYQTKATRAGSLRGSSGGYVERTVIGAGFWNQGVASNFLDGIMDEARVYNRVLSQEEITRLYKMGESKFNVSPELSLTDGLAGYWSFDGEDIYGATAYDRSGQGNDGAITNGPTKTIGKIGQALEFNGENYVNAGDDASLYMDDNFTVSWWMKSALSQKTWGGVLLKEKLQVEILGIMAVIIIVLLIQISDVLYALLQRL